MPTHLLIPIVLLALLLGGCREPGEPKPLRFDEKASPAPSGMGSFNLNKRHGLGDWEGEPQTSESELFRQMSQVGKNP